MTSGNLVFNSRNNNDIAPIAVPCRIYNTHDLLKFFSRLHLQYTPNAQSVSLLV